MSRLHDHKTGKIKEQDRSKKTKESSDHEYEFLKSWGLVK